MSEFTTILERMLALVASNLDKRQGSIIYDTLSPTAVELAQMQIVLNIWQEQTYLLTATGINLDYRGGDFAISRFQATNSIRIARMYNFARELTDIEIGDRFATPVAERVGLTFEAIEKIDDGTYLLRCEIPGSIGNEYFGDILPLFIRNNLGRAEIDGLWTPARDVETDDEYRKRLIERMVKKAFGGNIADYRQFTKDIPGVGDLRVYPVWNGGGTVKLSVIDASYNPITQGFIDTIKNTIDPVDGTGTGVGIAPIGHVVTVTTPVQKIVSIEADVLLDNRTVGQIQQEAENNIKDYFLSIRKRWGEDPKPAIFVLLVANAILRVDRVLNVSNVKLNGSAADLYLTEDKTLQELPFVGTVTLNA